MGLEKIKKKTIKELLEFSIINVDKPSGITSFGVTEEIKKIFSARKTGHFGTLDPKVTGVLPVALNRACKLSEFFMHSDKVYIGKMYLHSDISLEELKEKMEAFTGKIMQKPPVKSRVKRVLRERKVNKFEIIRMNKKKADFIADVEAGTYIRKLIHDLGEKIGGAHMIELRRVKAGIFSEKDSHSLEEIKKAFSEYKNGKGKKLKEMLIPAEIISKIIPIIQIKPDNLKQILTGKPIMKEDIRNKFSDERLFSIFLKDRFIGIFRKVDEGDIIARPEFVFN